MNTYMKNLFQKLLMLSIIASMAVLTVSCGEDDPELAAPIVSVSTELNGTAVTGALTAAPDDEITFNITATAEAGFNTLTLYTSIDGADRTRSTDINRNDLNIAVGTVEASVTSTYTVPETLIGSTIVFDFEVADETGKVGNTASVTVNVEDAGINNYTAVLIGGQVNSTLGSYYDAKDDQVMLTAAARDNNAKVDFIYYYLNTTANPNTAIIASADNNEVQATFEANNVTWPLTTENATRFQPTAQGFDFDAVATSTALENAYSEVGTPESRVVGLAVGQVVAFQLDPTRGGLYGLFKVIEISGTSGSDRAITIDVKVQQ